MNLEKYTIAEEGILSKLKERFTAKSRKTIPETKPNIINKSYDKDNDFDVRSIPKQVLDKEIELRKKEYLMCIEFFSNILKNKKKYFKNSEVLKNSKFELAEIKLLKNNRITEFNSENDTNFDYAYFYGLANYENFYNLWAKSEVLNIGNIELNTDIIQDDPSLDSFQESCNDICVEFEYFLKRNKFKCIKDYAADGLEDFCLWLSIDIGPSDEFLKQIKFYKK